METHVIKGYQEKNFIRKIMIFIFTRLTDEVFISSLRKAKDDGQLYSRWENVFQKHLESFFC